MVINSVKENNLIIIAAGNGTRMGEQTVPKVLYPILDSTNLERTYEFAKDLFDHIYIAVKLNDKKLFERFKMLNKMDKLVIVPISSGKGDGHAVLETLEHICIVDPKAILMWGDAVLQNNSILQELLDAESEALMVFPVRFEENPYVWFAQDEDGLVSSANFSKRGEVIPEGYHDQSIFRIHTINTKIYLNQMHCCSLRNGQYVGGELNFLHLVHYLYNFNQPSEFYETEHAVYSFNTVVEADRIEKSLKKSVKPV